MDEVISENPVDLPMETENVNAEEAITTHDAQLQKHRTDFTSELYKIELSNIGKFGYGVSKYFGAPLKIQTLKIG